jgi:sterile alpha motif and leucine zipper-containing kinase AZK
MVTEYLSGGNLYEVLHEKKTRINPVMLVQMAWQTALGLNYLHLSNPQILHRDLKPMNLLLDSNANVKICDFGLSCVKEKRAVVTESVGSPFWMAPEVLMGKPYNEKADVYSFGVLLYEFLTGVIPMR